MQSCYASHGPQIEFTLLPNNSLVQALSALASWQNSKAISNIRAKGQIRYAKVRDDMPNIRNSPLMLVMLHVMPECQVTLLDGSHRRKWHRSLALWVNISARTDLGLSYVCRPNRTCKTVVDVFARAYIRIFSLRVPCYITIREVTPKNPDRSIKAPLLLLRFCRCLLLRQHGSC